MFQEPSPVLFRLRLRKYAEITSAGRVEAFFLHPFPIQQSAVKNDKHCSAPNLRRNSRLPPLIWSLDFAVGSFLDSLTPGLPRPFCNQHSTSAFPRALLLEPFGFNPFSAIDRSSRIPSLEGFRFSHVFPSDLGEGRESLDPSSYFHEQSPSPTSWPGVGHQRERVAFPHHSFLERGRKRPFLPAFPAFAAAIFQQSFLEQRSAVSLSSGRHHRGRRRRSWRRREWGGGNRRRACAHRLPFLCGRAAAGMGGRSEGSRVRRSSCCGSV